MCGGVKFPRELNHRLFAGGPSRTREEHRCVNYPRRPISSGTRVNGYIPARPTQTFKFPRRNELDKSMIAE